MGGGGRRGGDQRGSHPLQLKRRQQVKGGALADMSEVEVGAVNADSRFDYQSTLAPEIVNSRRQIAGEGAVGAGPHQEHVAADAVLKMQLMIGDWGSARADVNPAHDGSTCARGH